MRPIGSLWTDRKAPCSTSEGSHRMTLTLPDAKAHSAAAQGRQIQYNQAATDSHGQNTGTWRVDCSGLICAIFRLAQGEGCPSTFEIAHGDGITGAPYDDRHRVIPYRTVTLVTNEDGSAFGHVALIVGYHAQTDQIQIQEHGGGIGPDIRWLPSGENYDSDQKYGHHRNFRLYDMVDVTGTAPTPPVVVDPTPGKGTPFPYPANEYFGDINGPDISHGGINASERAQVAAIQRIVGVRPTGIYDQRTISAVLAWQKGHHIAGITPTAASGPLRCCVAGTPGGRATLS